MRTALLLAALLLAATPTTRAQQGVERSHLDVRASTDADAARLQEERTDMTRANPADVASIDSILKALYDVISGPAGQKRDERRFRSLFAAGARLIPVRPRPKPAVGAIARVFTVEEFFESVNKNTEKMGFFEREVARQTQAYGDIAHVFSTYEARHAATDPKPFVRGINSIQLLRDGDRWWVMTIFWDAERPDGTNAIPKEYLPKGRGARSRR